MFKKFLSSVMVLSLALSLAACGGGNKETGANSESQSVSTSSESEESKTEKEPQTTAKKQGFTIAALKGPTAMGLSKLMKDSEDGVEFDNEYYFSLAGSADEVTPKLIQGEIDMACVPANLASVLYNKTEGQIVTLAVNTLGVLYIVEKGEEINSVLDLKGKTIVTAGKGSTPEYALRYLLSENGIDPDTDVTIDFKSEHSECVAALAGGQATVSMLPQPFATVALGKVEGARIALDLNKSWDELGNGSGLVTGVIVARKDALSNTSAVDAFLEDYKASVEYVNGNVEEAAAIIGGYEIVDEKVAKKAIPFCNIVCITKGEMKDKLSGYLEVLFNANPESVGGKVPDQDFYY